MPISLPVQKFGLTLPNFQMGTMACTWHAPLCNGFHVSYREHSLHNVHVELESDPGNLHIGHVDFAEWSCG